MPLNDDVMQIVRILEEEGFGAIAGELLMEISLGKELVSEDQIDALIPVMESGDDEPDVDAPIQREPIAEHEQVAAALDFIRLRLVEPVRRLAEAEQIAATFSSAADETSRPTFGQDDIRGTKISFVDLRGDRLLGFDRTEKPGEEQAANRLDDILRLIRLRVS